MKTDENNSPRADLINAGQPWIAEAAAQQDEHLRRMRTCTGGDYPNNEPGTEHAWDTFSLRPGVKIEQCWRCKVTRTDPAYQRKIEASE